MTAQKATNLQLKHDGTITIATGRSRKETAWKNREMQWSDLLKKLSVTTQTRETLAEYKKLTKPQQDGIKDIGGFVGGALKGGRRKTETVVWRHVLTLDADYVQGDLWSSVEIICDFACAVYSTHKHAPDNSRLRLVIPLARPVTPDEYPAIGRRIAADLGIDQFDDTTYEPQRLMYWPSTSSDGEFIYRYQDEPWLDPDKVLARYPDWKDPSYWPESSRVQQKRKKLAEKQGDPLAKTGVVGAFCRTYTIQDALETFLSDVYGPAGEGRYSYLAGSCAGGLVVYDGDTFVYSHHGTDPIGGKLCNAFDLVRIHKFGELDEDIEPDTVITKLPSYTAMLDFATNDSRVKQTMGEERLANAKDEFDNFDDPEEWLQHLDYTKRGEIVTSLANLVLILRHDPNLKGIAFDSHRGSIVLIDAVPWRKANDWLGTGWCDDDDASLRVYLEKVYKIWSPSKLNDALAAVSRERSFHPIRDYLEKELPEWDGLPRLEELLIDYLGAEDSPYTRAVTRKTLVAAIDRVYRPGSKFDYMLILSGPQGKGKSTLFARLGGKWFNDSLTMADMRDKTGAEKLQGYWILEVGELAGIRKAEIEAVKSFLSRQHDVYRPSYGRRTVEHPRQCVIVGSTNNDTFLRDSTGNRRFWPVKVTGVEPNKAPWNIDGWIVDMIWAEALECWKAGEDLFLTGDVAEVAYEKQKETLETDERIGLIQEYLDRLLPEDWAERSLADRRSFLYNDDFGESKGTVQRNRVCVAEIWCEVFNKDLASIKRFDMDDMHALLNRIDGWERYQENKSGKTKFPIYGVQRAYVRK